MIEVIDNFLPDDVAREFSRTFFNSHNWRPYWNTGISETNREQWNWHTRVGNDVLNMGQLSEEVPEEMRPLWEVADEAMLKMTGVKHRMDRWYSNSHTFGQEGPIHRDDGSLTCLYYPTEDFLADWEGGTAFYNEDITDCIKYASYKFNRMVIFDARIPHRAMPITRDCYKLRTSIVFKTSMDVNDPSYFEWYNNRKR
jgi:SM-20-related protein